MIKSQIVSVIRLTSAASTSGEPPTVSKTLVPAFVVGVGLAAKDVAEPEADMLEVDELETDVVELAEADVEDPGCVEFPGPALPPSGVRRTS